MFNVDDVDELLAKLFAGGAELIGEMRCEDAYRPATIRGPEGSLCGLPKRWGEPPVMPQGLSFGPFVREHRLSSTPVKPIHSKEM